MSTLTKADITENLYHNINARREETKEFVEDFFEEIRLALATGNPVKLSGFGSFELRDKAERPGRNPKTGEEIPITARRVVTFRAGQNLRDKMDLLSEENA